MQFRTDTDSDYLERLNVPGLRRAGDFKAAAVLDTQNRLLLYNVGREFPADWITRSARIAGTETMIRAAQASEAELTAWVALR